MSKQGNIYQAFGEFSKRDRNGEPPYDGSMEARFTALETRFDAILPTLMTKADGAEIRVEMQKIAGETHKWMIATVIGLFLGFGGIFLAMSTVLRPTTPSQPSQQAPIIINIPAQQPTPALPPAR